MVNARLIKQGYAFAAASYPFANARVPAVSTPGVTGAGVGKAQKLCIARQIRRPRRVDAGAGLARLGRLRVPIAGFGGAWAGAFWRRPL